jgi:hypothetical protein
MIRKFFVTAIVVLIIFCESSFAQLKIEGFARLPKNAITTQSIIATFTKEDCLVLEAMLQRRASFDEIDAMGNEGKLYSLPARAKIVMARLDPS